MTIILASDHGGFELKEDIKKHLSKSNIKNIDVGTHSSESVDYPDIAVALADKYKEIKVNDESYMIAFCGTGIGISIALNKIEGVYAALIYNKETAALAKEHNGVNCIAMGGRELPFEFAAEMLDIFLSSTVFEEQHARRRNEIIAIEKK